MTGTYDVLINPFGEDSVFASIDYAVSVADYVQEVSWSHGSSQPLQDLADEAQLTIVLDNSSGLFLPENPDSFLAPGNPGMRLYVQYLNPQYLLDDNGSYLLDDNSNRLTNDYDAYATRLYTGWMESMQPSWSSNHRIDNDLTPSSFFPGLPQATITGVSRKKFLDGIDIGLALYTNKTADFIIFLVLQTCSLVTNALLETGVQNIPYYGDVQTGDAYQMIADVVAAERGFFHFDRSANAVFWNRNHMTAAGSSAYTINTSDPTNAYLPNALEYEHGGLMSNSVKITANARFTDSSQTLYTLDSPVSIPVGQSKTWEAILRKANGEFAGVSSASVGTSSFSSGTGTVSVTAIGNRATVLVTNTGGVTAVLATLTITGVPITTQNLMEVVKEDSATLTNYGRRRFELNLQAVSTYADAESIADYELNRRKSPLGIIRSLSYARKIGTDDGFLNAWVIGTRLTINAPELYHTSKDYYIIGEAHRLIAAGPIHEATFYLEPAAMHS